MSTGNQIVNIESEIYGVAQMFERVSVDPNNVIFVREAEFAIQSLYANDFAMKMARQNPQSVRDAVTNIAAIGISLNPARKQAYLIPRKGGIVLQISYMGLLDLAIQSGSILWGQAELAYENDVFELNGYDKPPTHTRKPFSKERGELIGAYTVVKTKDGDYLTTTMTAAEVFEIRDRSDAWQAYLKDKRKCPWVTDEGEMVKKTVIKRAYKLWPKTDRLDHAVQYLNTTGGEGITFANEHAEPIEQPSNLGLSPARYKVLRAAANAALQAFNEGDEAGAYGEVSGITDQEEVLALWSILKPHSALRAALKRLSKEEHDAQAKLEAERAAALAASAKEQA